MIMYVMFYQKGNCHIVSTHSVEVLSQFSTVLIDPLAPHNVSYLRKQSKLKEEERVLIPRPELAGNDQCYILGTHKGN